MAFRNRLFRNRAFRNRPFRTLAAAALLLAPALQLPAGARPMPLGVDAYGHPAPLPTAYPPYGAPYSRPLPPPNPWAYGDLISDGADPLPPSGSAPYAAQPLTPMQMAQRCNTGRLVGGLLGGGLGYGLSRKDGRAWAIPLGALLGSQMGCSAAVGRGPRPW
jgi:hypothetical protein